MSIFCKAKSTLTASTSVGLKIFVLDYPATIRGRFDLQRNGNPGEVKTYLALSDGKSATALERYLKSVESCLLGGQAITSNWLISLNVS
jgi:hypothetical protein